MYWVLFDIDGTLLSSSGAGGRAMYAAVKEIYGADLPLGSVRFHGRTDRAIIVDILKLIGQEYDESAFLEVKEEYLRILPLELSQVDSQVFAGVIPLLEMLQGRDDVGLGLLTGNMVEGANLKLKHFAIDHFFSAGAYGDHHESRNLVAEDALRVIQDHTSSEISVENVWVIGDTPADIECARHIDAKVVAVGTGGYTIEQLRPHQPDILIETLEDCQGFLENLRPY